MHPHKRSRWLALSALLAVFVLLAAACGNDDDSESDAPAAPATAAPTAAPEPTEEPPFTLLGGSGRGSVGAGCSPWRVGLCPPVV